MNILFLLACAHAPVSDAEPDELGSQAQRPALRPQSGAGVQLLGEGDPATPTDSYTKPDPPPVVLGPEECDERILVPQGQDAVEPMQATAHQEVFGAQPEPFQVRYQWPDRDPSRSAAFLWRSDAETLASQIQFGQAETFPDTLQTLDGASFLFGDGVAGEGESRIHEVRLCERLTPGTSYSYRVGGGEHWSPTYTFTTPEAPGSFDTFRVAFAGDSRGAYETWGQMVTAMETHAPDFYMFSGDMVSYGTKPDEWDEWFQATGDVFAQKMIVTAHGNHESLAQIYFAQFAYPNNEQWFHYLYGDAVFVTLNDSVSDSAHVEADQVAYLEAVFSGSISAEAGGEGESGEQESSEDGAQAGDTAATAGAAPWRVVNHHRPVYSISGHGSNTGLQESWAPVYDTWGVAMVVSGHNHTYERSVPIFAGAQVAAGQGTTYMVSGGAGAPLYSADEDGDWFNEVVNMTQHYMIADFGPDSIEVVVRDLDGQVIDTFSVPRPSAE